MKKQWELDPAKAPGHTDLMVSPESLDEWLERNPLPPPVHVWFTCEGNGVRGSTAAKVKRVSWNDDGSLCVELDEWAR